MFVKIWQTLQGTRLTSKLWLILPCTYPITYGCMYTFASFKTCYILSFLWHFWRVHSSMYECGSMCVWYVRVCCVYVCSSYRITSVETVPKISFLLHKTVVTTWNSPYFAVPKGFWRSKTLFSAHLGKFWEIQFF